MDNFTANTILKLYNNQLENVFYMTAFAIKNNDDALFLIQQAIEKILLFDLFETPYEFKEKVHVELNSLIKRYVKTHQELYQKINVENFEIIIPNKLYLFNFNFPMLLNIQDNLLFLNALYNNELLGLEILKRLNEIFALMKKIYLSRIKIQFN